MPKYSVAIVYKGQSNFIVEADSGLDAEEKAVERYKNGDQGEVLGNEYEVVNEVFQPEEIRRQPDTDHVVQPGVTVSEMVRKTHKIKGNPRNTKTREAGAEAISKMMKDANEMLAACTTVKFLDDSGNILGALIYVRGKEAKDVVEMVDKFSDS